MAIRNKRLKISIMVLFFFGSLQVAQAKRKPKAKAQLEHSINEAMGRSEAEQERIRDHMNSKTDQMLEAWDEPSKTTLEIKHTGTVPVGASTFGSSDFSIDNGGEDQSGLDSLRGTIEEESTDIDFDEELREVSSMKE